MFGLRLSWGEPRPALSLGSEPLTAEPALHGSRSQLHLLGSPSAGGANSCKFRKPDVRAKGRWTDALQHFVLCIFSFKEDVGRTTLKKLLTDHTSFYSDRFASYKYDVNAAWWPVVQMSGCSEEVAV
ncbi:hypothetical protein GN956_G4895 [Arapaima gigas]